MGQDTSGVCCTVVRNSLLWNEATALALARWRNIQSKVIIGLIMEIGRGLLP
jgi:hypothetical protein